MGITPFPRTLGKNSEPIYMSPLEAVERYSLGRTTIFELLRMPDCPTTLKVGNRRLIPIKEFDAFLISNFSDEK